MKRMSVLGTLVQSARIGHSTTDNTLQHFQEGVLETDLDICIDKIVQVKMDGPNVNWKF